MSGADLLRWYNLVFLLPAGVSILLLGLSALSIGNEDSDGDGDADSDADDADDSGDTEDDNDSPNVATGRGIGGLIGIGRAPTSLVMNAFVLTWGLTGFWMNQLLVRTPEPGFTRVIPSLLVGLVTGLLGARGTAEVAARLMPKHDTKAASRQSLVLLKGRATFPISQSAGRVRVYDEHNTLHDNPARVVSGHPAIPKGRAIRVVDIDAQGRLIVEEEHSGSAQPRS